MARRALRRRYGRSQAQVRLLYFRDLPRGAQFTFPRTWVVYVKSSPRSYKKVPDDGTVYAATPGWNPQVEWL